MVALDPVASAASDYAAIQPAAVAAATAGRPLIIGWVSRGDGAPLELITTAAPVPAGAHPVPGPPTPGPSAAGLSVARASAAAPFLAPFVERPAAPVRPRGKH